MGKGSTVKDNRTSQPAALYDATVHKTIPYYHTFHTEALELIRTIRPSPTQWLDTGCGTGTLIARAAAEFVDVQFVAADPSAAMLELAKVKLTGVSAEFVQAGSEVLDLPNRFDTVTAVMVHHYLNREQRSRATKNCFDALKDGGVYITFETVRPFSDKGLEAGLRRWGRHQLASGKSPDEVEKHIARYGTELLPITIADHLELLRITGFSAVEILWASGLQAGFFAVK